MIKPISRPLYGSLAATAFAVGTLALGTIMALPVRAADASACHGQLCNDRPLASVADKLLAQRPVRILMIGDSHTAGDMVSDGWRQKLVQSYGSAGRGVVAGGRPYNGYLTWGINAGQSSGWRINGYFGKIWNEFGPAVGLSGYTKTASAPGEYLSLTSEAPQYNFDSFVLCGMAGPGAGSVSIDMGAMAQTVDFSAAASHPLCQEFRSSSMVGSVRVTTQGGGPVSITSMGTFRTTGGGVSLSNLGVPSSQFVHFDRTSEALLAAELTVYRPDLIVIAYGTNEGFAANLDLRAYEASLRAQISHLRWLTVTDVPIMLIGPPNSMTRNSALAHAGPVAPAECETGLMVPGNIFAVREIQRRVAAEMGLIFWDWGAAMGGPCAMYQWRAQGLTLPDAVHINREGGLRIGAILASDFQNALVAAASRGRPDAIVQ